MPVVNREIVLPVPRERAWELITEPSELEGWLGDDVEFEAAEDAPLRVDDREGVVEEVTEHERIVFRWGDSRVEWKLEDAISGYEGTVLLVSHDRAMLEALTSRVWVLHERHITDFPGSFVEWEDQSREREHAAAVAAAEEESLRRLKERKATRVRESNTSDQRSALRESRRRADAAEKEIATLEEQISRLTRLLEDPELYLTRDGTQKSVVAGKELEEVKRRLDAVFSEWTAATELIEKLSTEQVRTPR